MKRALSLLFAVLLSTIVKSTGFEREHPCQYHALIDGIYYYFDGDEAEVTYDSKIVSDNTFASYSGDVVIPEAVTYNRKSYKVTRIGYAAFLQCNDINSLTLPNSLTTIEKGAFMKCTIASQLMIPQSVNSIGWFDEAKIPSIVVDGNNKVYDSRDNCNAIIETVSNTLIVGVASSTIPVTVTRIEEWAFRSCTDLTAVKIPNSVTWIGEYAFSGCSGLTSLEIPNSVKTINSDAFSGCSSLATLTLHCTKVGAWFKNMASITDITFGDEVTEIVGGAFYGTTWYKNQPDGMIYAGKCVYEYKGGNRMPTGTDIVIEDGTKGIAGSAFMSCSGMTSVTIPSSVQYIGSKAFYGCSGLSTMTVPKGITDIRDEVFYGCSSLTSVNIPGSVADICNGAFQGCSSLTSIIIPEHVGSIGSSAFSNCTNLVSVTVERTNPIKIYSPYIFTNSSNAVLYVPSGSKANYEAAAYWNSFKEIVEYTPKCSIPVIHFEGGKVRFDSETYGVKYVSMVTVPDASDGDGEEIDLTQKFKVSVYATKDGYANSDVATQEIDVRGLKGDVNEDGKVTITDAVGVVDIILNEGK